MMPPLALVSVIQRPVSEVAQGFAVLLDVLGLQLGKECSNNVLSPKNIEKPFDITRICGTLCPGFLKIDRLEPV